MRCLAVAILRQVLPVLHMTPSSPQPTPRLRPVRAAAQAALKRLKSTSHTPQGGQFKGLGTSASCTAGTTAPEPSTKSRKTRSRQKTASTPTNQVENTDEQLHSQPGPGPGITGQDDKTQNPTTTGRRATKQRRTQHKSASTQDDGDETAAPAPIHSNVADHVEAEPARAKPVRKKQRQKAQDIRPDTNQDSEAACFSGTISRSREQQLLQEGYKLVVGVDEAGRGPLAGPVVAAACALPEDLNLTGIDDSKKLNEQQREELYTAITSHPGVLWNAQIISRETIDEVNILQATLMGMRQSVGKVAEAHKELLLQGAAQAGTQAGQQLQPAGADAQAPQCYCIVDGNKMPDQMPIPGEIAKGGDRFHYCIAAASIIAKVTRDRLMQQYDVEYPQFGFAKHKGYGTAAHVAAIKQHGPCPIHRRSFEPVKSMVSA